MDRNRGRPVEDSLCAAVVGPGHHHIRLMERLVIHHRLPTHGRLDHPDEGIDGHRLTTAAQVDDLVALDVGGGDGAAGDVIDVGEVAGLGAVAVDGDGDALADVFDKAVDGHVGSTAGPVDGEVAEDAGVDTVEVVVGVGHHLGGLLGGGVGAERPVAGHLLMEGGGLSGVEGGGGGEDEVGLGSAFLEGFEEIEGAVGIGAQVERGILHRSAHTGAGGEVEYGREAVLGEEGAEGVGVLDIAFDKGEAVAEGPQAVQPELFEGGVVVVVEVVEPDDGMALLEEHLSGACADKPGGTGYE